MKYTDIQAIRLHRKVARLLSPDFYLLGSHSILFTIVLHQSSSAESLLVTARPWP